MQCYEPVHTVAHFRCLVYILYFETFKSIFNSVAGIILVFHQGKETFLLFFFVVFDSLHGTEAAFPVSKTSQTNFFSFF
jgi:hypothetical protein